MGSKGESKLTKPQVCTTTGKGYCQLGSFGLFQILFTAISEQLVQIESAYLACKGE